MERVKGERWPDFRDRHGDWGRDLALWLARHRAGLTLRQLGKAAGGMDYSAVSEAIRHFERVHLRTRPVRVARQQTCQFLNLET